MIGLSIPIKKIFFGHIDASTEIDENPELFVKNFYDINDVVKTITSNPVKFLILGKKGTGKTSVSKYIELNNILGRVAKCINFESFDYKQFSIFKDDTRDEYEKYSVAWRWIILSLLIDLISTDKSSKESTGDLMNFSQKIFGKTEINLNRLLSERYKEGVNLDLEMVPEILGYKKDLYTLEDINVVIEFLITQINFKQNEYYLVIDGLDEKVKKEDYYIEPILSFLWSISRINQEFRNKKLPIKIITSFRNDLFEMIGGSNIYKKYLDNSIEINWVDSSKDKYSYPLADLISTRINNSIENEGAISIEGNVLKLILPNYIHGKDWSRKTWDFILDLTTYKPRDIVAFLRECQRLCDDRLTIIPERVIWDALNNYSKKYLVLEFKSEVQGHVTKEQADEIFDVIFPAVGKTFNYMVFLRMLQRSKHCNNLKVGEILRLFYELGILGYYINNRHIEWYHREKSIIKKEFNSEQSKFQINQGLFKALSFW